MLKAGIPRDQLYFTSKVPPKMINYEDAKKCVEESLKKTGLDYIDLYLLHAPYGGKEGRLGAWRALVEAVDAGKVKSIGVSNYGVHHLDELEQWQKVVLNVLTFVKTALMTWQSQPKEKAGILSVNQVELHPWLPRPDIVDWCEKRGVVLEAYSPLVRATRMDDPLLGPLIKKYNKTGSQILLRWGLQKGFVILPKSVTKSRIEKNKELYDFELSKEDMESLKTDKYEPCAWDPTKAPLGQ
jgi:diketogulonate reductase-like aldo/keto reductase